MEMIILTGMSGAGKSLAVNFLEDMGYFCIDNVPPQMLESMVQTFSKWESSKGISVNKVAFVVDIRSVSMFSGLKPAFDAIDMIGIPYRIIYLDASDQILLNRYKQSRRNHPLADGKGIAEGITLERNLMSQIKEMTPDVINTTNIEPSELRDILFKMLSKDNNEKRMSIFIQSFGFKYGIPVDCDNIIDVRFIPNPYYIAELKPMSGLDAPVKENVMSFPETKEFMDKMTEMFLYAIPFYSREGKVRLNIGIGCTGGRHRSVALAEELARRLIKNGLNVAINHRDINNDAKKRNDK
ncbi:MAG: RNase adapter RapZ [Saccharofermentanales bacterium]